MLHKQRLLACEITRQYRQRKKKCSVDKKKKQPTVNFKNNIPTKGVYFFKNYSYIQFNSTLNKLDHIPCIQVTIFRELGAETEDVHFVTFYDYVYRVICLFGPVLLFVLIIYLYTVYTYICIFTEIPVCRMKDRMYTRRKMHKRYTGQTLHHD